MTGLLEKDFRLLFVNAQSIFVVLITSIAALTQSGSFILGYFPIVMSMLFTSTISYDEIENGYEFLLTLPVTKKLYVREKYLFCMAGTALSWVVSGGLYLIAEFLHKGNFSSIPQLESFSLLLIAIFYLCIVIPMQLKYGAEKFRLILFSICGAACGILFLFNKITNFDWINFFDQKNPFIMFAVFCVFTGISAVVSYVLSCRIMEQKQF